MSAAESIARALRPGPPVPVMPTEQTRSLLGELERLGLLPEEMGPGWAGAALLMPEHLGALVGAFRVTLAALAHCSADRAGFVARVREFFHEPGPDLDGRDTR